MKTLQTLLCTLALVLTAQFAQAQTAAADTKVKVKTSGETLKIKTSAVCDMCKARLEKSLAYEKGVQSAVLDVPSQVLTVTYRADKTSADKLRALQPERAWNVGGSFTQYFTVASRPATFVADYYHTEFQNQVVADMYSSPDRLLISNLYGRSFSRSLQTEVQVEPLKGLQAKAAYKFLDVQTSYGGQLLPKFLTPRHRLFANLSYATAFDKWRFDLTGQWFGRRPLAVSPGTAHSDPYHNPLPTTPTADQLSYTPRYVLFNAQVTRAFKRWEVYAGAENLLNYRQPNPIIGASDPFGPNFDAAMVWGPTFGRLTYAGLRFRLQ